MGVGLGEVVRVGTYLQVGQGLGLSVRDDGGGGLVVGNSLVYLGLEAVVDVSGGYDVEEGGAQGGGCGIGAAYDNRGNFGVGLFLG